MTGQKDSYLVRTWSNLNSKNSDSDHQLDTGGNGYLTGWAKRLVAFIRQTVAPGRG